MGNDEQQIGQAIAELFSRMQPEAALIGDAALSQRQARELRDAHRLQNVRDLLARRHGVRHPDAGRQATPD